MSNQEQSPYTRLIFLAITLALISLVVVAVVSAASEEPVQPAAVDQADPTTLAVTIVTAPWATLDDNDPTGGGTRPVPQAFVVQAVVSNTGTSIAEGLMVTLDYEDASGSWALLDGEDPIRQFLEPLAAAEAYSVYWFATYMPTVGASHQYTVTAEATNAAAVSTSENDYGLLAPDVTVQTIGAQNTGSTGVLNVAADVVVGTAFTVTVDFDLSTKPEQLVFSPVGNLDFDPSRFRLLATEVNLYDNASTLIDTIPDRLYFPNGSVPAAAETAEVVYTFVATAPGDMRLCPYTTVGKSVTYKYGNDFCLEDSIVAVASTVTLSLTKQVNAVDIRQGESLTYTLTYTNNGSLPLVNLWIWDEVDPTIGAIASASGTPAQLSDQQVAWYVGDVDQAGGVQSTGTLTFTIDVDGGGADIPDQTLAVNNAFFGIDPGALPDQPALTATVTTTVLAPTITVAKTDGLETVNAGGELTYTLRITNSGSITAANVLVTDLLPPGVSYAGSTTWTPDPIPPNGGTWTVDIPVTVSPSLPDGTILANSMTATYENEAGWSFEPETATDQTTVETQADLEIVKSDDPDPVAAGATLTYTLTYTNNGPSDAQNVVIVDTLDEKTTYDSVVTAPPMWGAPTYDPGPPATLTWDAATIAAGDSGAIVLTAIVNADTFGIAVNNVAVTSDTPDDNPANSTDDETTIIGDLFHATLYGYAFVDTNCNGTWDGAEMPLPDVTIGLSGPGPVQVPATTDPDGLYYFILDTPGIYSVLEQDPTGYFSTTPNEVHVAVALGNGYRVDFGDSQGAGCAALYGTVFEDLDGNTLRGSLELGIKDVTITLDDSAVTTTDDYGIYTFPTTATGPHTVVETDPVGYLSTTPNEVTVDVALADSYEVSFGDLSFCTCLPDRYEEDDTWADAVELGLGLSLSQTHDFCDDAADWTKFTATAGWIYTMTTSSWGQRADTFLYLYDTDGQTLLAANDDYEGTDDYSSRIVWEAPTTGVYYLLTTNRAGLTGCETDYDLWIEPLERRFVYLPTVTRNDNPPVAADHNDRGALAQDSALAPTDLTDERTPAESEDALSPTGIITHTCPDDYEIDDTWELAKPINDGDLQVHSFDSNPAVWAADKDFVSFSIEANDTITFTVPAITGTATLLELYDQDGDALNVTDTEQLVWTAPAGGRYYLSVSPRLAAYGCADVAGYKLKAEMSSIVRLYLPMVLRAW